ncbi:MAG: hypothetical protein KF781_10330 [Chitinophagaceae bacterium]|nr:hypothetical protein [Chitinophagaceae bacterium]MCW5904916.1 hypothetical protein [Chitinophagaceae bacterium]
MKNKIIYQLDTEDVQLVANEIIERKLSSKELKLIEDVIGDYINWFDAIENAIHQTIKNEKK